MTQQFARVPVDAGDVVREVRGFGGVPWQRLFRYLRPHLAPFSVAIVGLLISSGVGLAFPLVIAGITSQVVAGGDPAGLDSLIVMLVVLFCVQAVGGFVQTWLLGVVGERVVAQLRGELYGRLVTLSLDFHGQHRVGELVSRLSSDVTLVRTMLTQTVTSLLSSLIGLIGSVIILFTLSPTLLLVVLLLAPALIVVAIVFGRPLQRVSTQVQDTIARSTTTAEEVISGIRVVKSYVREDWELQRYDADLRSVVTAGSRLALWRAGLRGADGVPGLRGHRPAALVHRSPGHRRHARGGDPDGVPAVRRGHRGESGDDREPVRAVPRGDRRGPARVRDHRHAGPPSSTRRMPRRSARSRGASGSRASRSATTPSDPSCAISTSTSGQGRASPWSARPVRARPRSSG